MTSYSHCSEPWKIYENYEKSGLANTSSVTLYYLEILKKFFLLLGLPVRKLIVIIYMQALLETNYTEAVYFL